MAQPDDVHRLFVQQAAHRGDHRVEPFDEPAHQRHSEALGARHQRAAGREARGHRLLDQDRLPQLEQRAGRALVERGRGCDDGGVAPGSRIEILGKVAAKPFGERSHPFGIRVDDHREVGAVGLRDDSRVIGPHRPGSDQRDPRACTHGRSLSPAGLPDRRFAGPFR